MPDLREEMAALADELNAIPEELGFRERVVVLRTVTTTGENRAEQIEGVETISDTTIAPRPTVREGGFKLIQYAQGAGLVVEEGDLVIEAISRSLDEDLLRSAIWLVDGEPHRLLTLRRKATAWEAFVRRAKS